VDLVFTGMNRSERTVKKPATFVAERCLWSVAARGRVITVMQRVQIVTMEWFALRKADRPLLVTSIRYIPVKIHWTQMDLHFTFYAPKIIQLFFSVLYG
jgi:hypothetical protein